MGNGTVQVTIKKDGKVIHDETLNERTFSSGSKGWGSYGKLPLDDKDGRGQLSFNLVVVGTKPAPKGK